MIFVIELADLLIQLTTLFHYFDYLNFQFNTQSTSRAADERYLHNFEI